MSIQEQIRIAAIRFQFLPDEQGWRLDTIPFYVNYVRSFLLGHEGDVVWVKGGIVERSAYLMFVDRIENKVTSLVRSALSDLKRVKITPGEQPWRLFHECKEKQRVFIGYLKLDNVVIGESRRREVKVRMRKDYCLICPYINGGRCSLIKHECLIDKPWLMDGNYGTILGNLRDCELISVKLERVNSKQNTKSKVDKIRDEVLDALARLEQIDIDEVL